MSKVYHIYYYNMQLLISVMSRLMLLE